MKWLFIATQAYDALSPSPRRAWIEIPLFIKTNIRQTSPSPRRAWIEILESSALIHIFLRVALPTEGVD